jgi:hypothetical protein
MFKITWVKSPYVDGFGREPDADSEGSVLPVGTDGILLAQREALRRSREGGAQPNVSKAKIVRRPFPLPPVNEQRRIVEQVRELFELVDDALESNLSRIAPDEDVLLEALLKQTFDLAAAVEQSALAVR